MATHSSVLAWRIPGTREPGGLPSMGSHSRTRLKQFSSSSRCHIIELFLRSCSVDKLSPTLWSHGLKHAKLPCLSLSLGVCSNSCPLSQLCPPTISSSVAPFYSCPQSFLASMYFPMSQLFVSGGQSIGASASASVLPVNIQGWFLLGLTGLISLQSKGVSRVFSSTMVRKHQFFGTQPILWSNSHIHIWLLEKS